LWFISLKGRRASHGTSIPAYIQSVNEAKRGKLIGSTIRARVKRGLLEPLEKIELPEGKEITLTILGVASDANVEAFRRSAGSWKGSVDAEKLIRNIYNDRLVTTRSKPRL